MVNQVKYIKQTKHAGFSLIEVLLAVTLLGIIMALAYGGLRTVIKSTDRADELIQEQTHLRATQQFLHRQLARALPLNYFVDDSDQFYVFEGDGERLQFVAPMPGYLGAGGPQVQELALERTHNGYELLFKHVPLLSYEDGILRDVEPITLLRGLADGEFLYIGLDREGRLSEWENEWEETDEIPVAVSMDLSFAEDSLISWPILNVSMRIDGTAGRLRRNPRDAVQPTGELGRRFGVDDEDVR